MDDVLAARAYSANMANDGAILITGASSGLGQALALAYAAPGVVLHLAGRASDRLENVAQQARNRGATAIPTVLDVTDAAATAAWIAQAGRLFLVVANAGISANGPEATETAPQTRAIFSTNLDGALNTVLPALAAMAAQPPGPDGMRGTIAVVASIAAFIPAPLAPAYCASKAALDFWAVASAPAARQRGIHLASICPGYIHTPMTAKIRAAMPGAMEADRAARIIQRGLAAGRIRIVFPWWMGWAARLSALLPPRLLARLLAHRD